MNKVKEIWEKDAANAFSGLERTSILLSMVHDVLGYYDRESQEDHDLHPCIKTQEAKELVGRICDDLASLYQMMGQYLVDAEDMKNTQENTND